MKFVTNLPYENQKQHSRKYIAFFITFSGKCISSIKIGKMEIIASEAAMTDNSLDKENREILKNFCSTLSQFDVITWRGNKLTRKV